MKKSLFLIILIFSTFCVNAQKNVFVLVDLSKSIDPHQLQASKKVLTQILSGISSSDIEFQSGNASDLQEFKLKPNDKLSITNFGDREFTWKMNPKLRDINSSGTIDDIINSVSWYPNQEWTYYTLAKAVIAKEARKTIKNYLLCIIGDGYDSFPSNGQADYSADQTGTKPLRQQYSKIVQRR